MNAKRVNTAAPTVYRVLDGATTAALYTSAEQARKHCEWLARREYNGTGTPRFFWSEGEDTRDQPEQGPAWLMEAVKPGLTRATGLAITPLPLADLFAEADPLVQGWVREGNVYDELAGANLSLWEEERESARLRLALKSAQRGRRRLRAERAALESAAIEGRAALAAFCYDLDDPGTAALGALYLLQQVTPGATMMAGETVPLVYRASHDSIVFGLYNTAAAAREHCETLIHRDIPGAGLDWIEDEEDGVAELVAAFGDDERSTGYVVTALEVAAKYEPEADE